MSLRRNFENSSLRFLRNFQFKFKETMSLALLYYIVYRVILTIQSLVIHQTKYEHI